MSAPYNTMQTSYPNFIDVSTIQHHANIISQLYRCQHHTTSCKHHIPTLQMSALYNIMQTSYPNFTDVSTTQHHANIISQLYRCQHHTTPCKHHIPTLQMSAPYNTMQTSYPNFTDVSMLHHTNIISQLQMSAPCNIPKYLQSCLNELTFKGNIISFIKLLTIFCAVCMSLLMVIYSKKIYIKVSKHYLVYNAMYYV